MKLIMSDKPVHIDISGTENIKHIDLSSMKIANCVGCFGCWTKTPGKCVIRDDATKVYPYIAQSDSVIYVSHIKYGGYDSIMKTMLERAIPIQQAFIRIHNGETHHIQRNVKTKEATIIAYGSTDPEEQDIFRRLISRNAKNMCFKNYEVIFVPESEIEETIHKTLRKWEK